MTIRNTLVASAAMLLMAGAQATTSTSTAGLTTTYTDDFNNAASMFTVTGGGANGIVNAGADDFLLLINGGSASFSFVAAQPLTSLAVSFWYTQNDTGATASLATTTINLADTTSQGTLLGAAQFAGNNPGSSTGGTFGINNQDRFNTSLSFTNLGAGNYTLTFTAPSLAGNLTGVKIDDVTILATAVPEPETYAMMIAGLGALGWMSRRRKAQREA